MSSNKLNLKHAVLEKIIELNHQVFFIYDLQEQKFIHLNKAFKNVWEKSIESVINQDALLLIDTVHPEDTTYVQKLYSQLLTDWSVKNAEFRILMPDNVIKWVCLTAYIFEDDHKKLISGIIEDISKMKEYNFNILKFNAKKNSVLEILSHDLSAPFATIQGIVGLLQKKTEHQANENIYQLLHVIEETCKRGRNLIKDFVDNEFLESSQIVLHKERTDIVHRIKHIMEEYKNSSLYMAKQFNLVVPDEPLFIELDGMKFMQVINNLISNAIKFTEENGKVTVKVTDQGDTVLFTIQDNGIGIPEEMHPYLFDKFTKARRPGIRGEQSTGLGMSIIKNIIELHNGRIWFESKEDQGSSFFVEIPKNDYESV